MTKKTEDTTVPLRDFIVQVVGDLEKRIDLRFDASQQAVEKAESAMTRRLEGMNELRAQLDRQAALFITRDELGALLKQIVDDVKRLQLSEATLAGKASQSSLLVSMLFSLGAFILGVLGLLGR